MVDRSRDLGGEGEPAVLVVHHPRPRASVGEPRKRRHRVLPGPDERPEGERVRNLTVRGRCFLAAGAAAVVCGLAVGERDFVRIGLLAALVPLLTWLLLYRSDHDLSVRRMVSTPQLEAGETAQVEVQVGNAGRRTGLLLLEEHLPAALGETVNFDSAEVGKPPAG